MKFLKIWFYPFKMISLNLHCIQGTSNSSPHPILNHSLLHDLLSYSWTKLSRRLQAGAQAIEWTDKNSLNLWVGVLYFSSSEDRTVPVRAWLNHIASQVGFQSFCFYLHMQTNSFILFCSRKNMFTRIFPWLEWIVFTSPSVLNISKKKNTCKKYILLWKINLEVAVISPEIY